MNPTTSCTRCGGGRDVPDPHRCPGPADPRDVFALDGGAGRVLDLLAAHGRPFLVGGAVRDAVLREVGCAVPVDGDVDVEVHGVADTDALVAALRAAGAVVVPTGARFEVLKVVLDAVQVDVAVSPGRASADDVVLVESAGRRDFTVNAIAWDPATNEFVDPVGGIEDASAGVLRHPSDRFGEDPLRVLRAVQLVSRFGFTVHPGTVSLARSLRDRFHEIATERLWPEFRKLATGDHLSAALRVLHEVDWERHLPELAAVRDVPQDPRWHPEGPVHVHAGLAGDAAARACTEAGTTGEDRVVIVLGAVLHDLGKAGDGTQLEVAEDGTTRIRSLGHEVSGAVAARRLLRRLGAPKRVADRIVPLIREHMVAHSTGGAAPSVPAARRLLRRLGGTPGAAEAWVRVCDADARGRGAASAPSPAWWWFEVMTSDAVADRQVPLLTGRDLIAAGLVPGPVFTAVLTAASVAQDEGVFEDQTAARAWLHERLADESA